MAKLTRVTSLLFGSTAGASQIGEFGSYANGTPTYSSSPATIQSLSNWLEGWFGAVLADNSPCIEDMNGFCYVMSYLISYVLQEGIPEWDTGTTYYTNSFVQSSGVIYVSLTDANAGNAVSNATYWKRYASGSLISTVTNASTPVVLAAANSGTTYLCDVTSGNIQFELPSPATVGSGFVFTVVDKNGLFSPSGSYAYLTPNASELIIGLNSQYNMQAPWGYWTIFTDGTNWYRK